MSGRSKELVPVGQVFEIFPGRHGYSYFGITVVDNPFPAHCELVFRPTGSDGTKDIRLKAATIEIERQRTNLAKPGDSCAICPAEVPEVLPEIGWQVLVLAADADSARYTPQALTARPIVPEEVAKLGQHRCKG